MADEKSLSCDSKEGMDVADPTNSKPGAKRRVSRAGTRSVASLTPEQLLRKRANDREAQRSIRQRTKTHIEELEQRIRELSQDPDARNFEQIQRRNVELEMELRQLRELLGRSEGSVTSSPEPTPLSYEARYGMDIMEEIHPLAYSTTWNSQHMGGPGSPYSPFPISSAGNPLSSSAPEHSGLPSGFSDLGSARSDLPTAPVPTDQRGGHNSRPQFCRSRSDPHGGLGLPSNNPPSRINGSGNGISPSLRAGQPISPVNRSLMMNVNGLRQPQPPTSHPLISEQSQPRIDGIGSPHPVRTAYEGPGRPAWETSLRFLPPTGPADSILMGLLRRQRSLAAQNIPGSALTGPYHPDLRALVSPEVPRNLHPVVPIISDLFQRIDYTGFAEKAAALFLVYHYMQWQILPIIETYQNVPVWFRPRPSQLGTAHPCWVSLVIWGPLRDVIIGDQQRYATEEFMNIYQSSITVNWPLGDEDVLVLVGEEVRVTDTFVRHVEDQANWSLNEPFQRRYPELRDVCRFSELS